MTRLGHDDRDPCPGSRRIGDVQARAVPGDPPTIARPARAIINTPPQLDNGFQDSDSFDNVDPSYSDEGLVHTPGQTTSANNKTSQRPGASLPRQDRTAPSPPRQTSTMTTRGAPSDPTLSTMPEITNAPCDLSAMSHDPKAMAQMALAHPPLVQTGAGVKASNTNIDPDLLNPTTTGPLGSKTTSEFTFGGRESTQPVLLDGRRVQPNERMNSQPSTSWPPRSPRSGSSRDNNKVGGGKESGSSNTARPQTQRSRSRNSGHAGSVFSTSSSKPIKCIREDTKLLSKLFKRIDVLVNAHDANEDHLGPLALEIKDTLLAFYDEHACGQAKGPKQDEILGQINSYGVTNSLLIVNWVDNAYAEAGWHLKHRTSEESRAGSPILDAHSQPSLPRPNGKNSPNRPPAAKRITRSWSGTSPSAKRSRQDSTLQSINSAGPESRTSLSQSQVQEEFHCGLCRKVSQSLRKWKRHYDTHLPRFFWACVFENCDFFANVPHGIVQHCVGRHQMDIRSDPTLTEKLKRNKFEIFNGGHERCIYCDVGFSGNDSITSRSHIVSHFKDMTAEARRQAFNHRCSNSRCGKKDGEDGEKAYWKSNPSVRRENRRRASADDDTEVNSRGDGSEGDDGNDPTTNFEGEDEQGPGGSVTRGNGGSGDMGRGNYGSMGGSSWGGSGGGQRMGGEKGGGNGGGSKEGHKAVTTRHPTPNYKVSGRGHASSDHKSTFLRSPRDSPSADLMHPMKSFLHTPGYGVGGNFTPSKSNVPVVKGQMRSQLNALSGPLQSGTE